MLKSFKYRIYPTDDQVIKLSNIFGQVRFVYNLGLETKINADRDINAALNIRNFGLRNQSSITQRKSLDYACGVETHKSLVCV